MRKRPMFSKRDSFRELLFGIDPALVSNDAYCVNYFKHLVAHADYFISIYDDVLRLAVKHGKRDLRSLSMLDYGAGNGLLGIYAKYCGAKEVYLNDRDEKFLAASQSLSSLLSIKIDKFISGDIDDVKHSEIIPDVIIGTDVIEHIYDTLHFFNMLKNINSNIVSVFTTSSNPENAVVVKRLKKLQYKDEFIGNDGSDPISGPAHPAYVEIRKDIIRENFPKMLESEIEKYAKATRGLIYSDIITLIEKSGADQLAYNVNSLTTNTCHPYTGSWTERILTINQYREIFKKCGFSLDLYEGRYDEYKPGFKKVLNNILNLLISVAGRKVAPFIILVGEKIEEKKIDGTS